MSFADPRENVLQIGLHDGMKVGDLGAGSGHYALAAAGAVGDTGRVYAIDVQEEVVMHIRDAAHRAGLKNVETIWGDFERPGGTKLKDGVLDAAILSNVMFQVEHHTSAISEVKRIVHPGGKVLVIDWAGSYGHLGPHPDQVVPESEAERLFIQAGFHKAKSFRAGPHHYGILFTTPAS
ncbi:MAG: methyltransferase domain-containing protein [Candidatus Pacebacteria bacterium]|nr:methyltransferase domain-containing protein [Candidatus Paceibacterota bacterium]MBP9840408.1 methyltransferase domain-containing protein [Candidatus Paceibacterota bacterium]